jgi:hypothetical protein
MAEAIETAPLANILFTELPKIDPATEANRLDCRPLRYVSRMLPE